MKEYNQIKSNIITNLLDPLYKWTSVPKTNKNIVYNSIRSKFPFPFSINEKDIMTTNLGDDILINIKIHWKESGNNVVISNFS